jgi:protein-tyrosine phosphatase
MLPLVDIHCHLLAGLDDGPRTQDEAVEMCRMAYQDGTGSISAGAHQNDHYPENTPDRIREAVAALKTRLEEEAIPLSVFPNAEVEVHPDMLASFRKGELLTVADRGQFMLVEMPHGVFVDLRGAVSQLKQEGLRVIIAHAERVPELLHDSRRTEDLIAMGCLVQVSSRSITHPPSRTDGKAIRDWIERDMAHLLGSDGHSPKRRRPLMRDAYNQIASWAGPGVADRIGSATAQAIIQGRSFIVPRPKPPQKRWFPWLW